MEKTKLIQSIKKLKQEKDVLILAHYYVDESIQQIADFVGDSYYLSQMALNQRQETILFCGVKFMGESAKILSPHKKIIMADIYADCPMAHMAQEETVEEVKGLNDDVAVVCYINSTVKVKALSDICVTSSNAVKIISKLKQKNIFFIPDEHLGRYVQKQLPEKHFILNNGFCHVHTSIKKDNVLKAKECHPEAEVLVHPECTWDIVELADYVGSTSGIIDYATKSKSQKFIICTEMGILYELKQKNPSKQFYSVGHRQFCPNMKRINLENVYQALITLEPEVHIPEELMLKAKKSLEMMHILAQSS